MSSTADRLRAAHRAVRRAVLRRRRLLAALCAAGAVAAGVHATAPPPPATTRVLTAARDLPAGGVLEPDDVVAVELVDDAVPTGLVTDPVGRTLAAPLREGEPVTDVRLVGDELAAAHPELATLPVRFPDAGLAGLLEVGDRIDLVATDPQSGGAHTVATDVLVLATPAVADEPATALPGVVVVLGVPPSAVTSVSEASVRWFLGYAFSR